MDGYENKNNFAVNSVGIFRHFKIVQTMPGINGEYFFALREIEIFGTLYNRVVVEKCTKKGNPYLERLIFIYIFALGS
jgi:hypothetical protein